jgi:hypothetical protein
LTRRGTLGRAGSNDDDGSKKSVRAPTARARASKRGKRARAKLGLAPGQVADPGRSALDDVDPVAPRRDWLAGIFELPLLALLKLLRMR